MAHHPGSALYAGSVSHKRLSPFRHGFRYRVFSLCLDLDDMDALRGRLRLFSLNRWNLFSFHERDHGPGNGDPLRPWLDEQLARAGIDLDGGQVRLLCFPRVVGYVFNPLSVWFCFHSDGDLRAVLYEVSNTFGERHCYLMPMAAKEEAGRVPIHGTVKRFHVSPFLEAAGRYEFRVAIPEERLAMAIAYAGPSGSRMVARHAGRRLPLTDRTLARLFVTHPLMTLKVIAAIHWQALRLWLKGAKVRPHPSPPPDGVTIIAGARAIHTAAAD